MRNNARMINEKVGKKRCKVKTFKSVGSACRHFDTKMPKTSVHGVVNQEKQSAHIYIYIYIYI